MVNKMPKELQPNRAQNISQVKEGGTVSAFPTMFEDKDKK
jgi:hypothetical protein